MPTNPAPKRATIMDVAAQAGVSKSLVSLAFKDPSKVSDERLLRIRQAAQELDYSPSFVARTLTSQQSPFIGILVLDLQNPIFTEVANAVRRTLTAHGEFGLLISGSEDARGQADKPYGTVDTQVLHMLQSLRPKALIVVGTVLDENLLPPNTPVIYASTALPEGSEYTCVRADDREGMQLIVEHLVKAGHRHIAFVTGSSGAVTQERQAAYEAELEKRGLHPAILAGDYTEAGGFSAGQQLLALPERPTAVITVNDLAALGIMHAIEEAGLKVPRDLAVAGFDNIYAAGLPRVSLTSVDPSKGKIGELAALQAIQAVQVPETATAERLWVQPALIIRGSTGA